jgi:serine/threonine protein kinase
MPLEPGTRLGPYVIEALAGAGGMGEVYRARDRRLGRIVAIKIIAAALGAQPEMRRRFDDEARIAASLDHPRICAVYDVGHDADLDYLVMELVEGRSLAARISAGPLPLRELIGYAIEMAQAMAYAHARGIVHRDLKPGNVLLTSAGIKIIDFGIGKLRRDGQMASGAVAHKKTAPLAFTSPGSIPGTAQYVPPERLQGGEGDHRSDIFAFGTVVYEMASGRRAFEGSSPADLVAAILTSDPPPLIGDEPGVAELDWVVRRCLRKNPEERWQSMVDVEAILKRMAASTSSPVTAASKRPLSWAINRWTTSAASVLGVLAVLAFVPYFAGTAPDPKPTRFEIYPPPGWVIETGKPNPLSISPDGRRIVFAASKDGRGLLWVRSLETVDAEPLTGTDNGYAPFWSPDSRYLGFFTTDAKLKTISVTGGSLMTVCDGCRGEGTWGRSGLIVFAPGRTGVPLQKVPASGGTPTPATALGKDEITHRRPNFLPDGQHFLYYVNQAAAAGPGYVASLDPAEPRRRVSDDWRRSFYAGAHVLFARESTLMAQPWDAWRVAPRGDAFAIVEGIQTPNTAPVFSASENDVLVYQNRPPHDGQLVWFNRRGERLGVLGAPADYGDIEVAPDGKRVAVTLSDAARGRRILSLLDVARGVTARFTTTAKPEYAPIWSPDGNRIAFSCSRSSTDICQRSSNGAGAEELLLSTNRPKVPVAWSPDGRFILYIAPGVDDHQVTLWVLPLVGDRKPFPFAEIDTLGGSGQFSRDGRWIAYVSGETGRDEVYIASFPDSGRKTRVSSSGGSYPRWRRDGTELFYITPIPEAKLMSAPLVRRGAAVEVGAVRTLFDPHVSRSGRYMYDVSPDGQRFLVNTIDEAAQTINVVLNWPAALIKR